MVVLQKLTVKAHPRGSEKKTTEPPEEEAEKR